MLELPLRDATHDLREFSSVGDFSARERASQHIAARAYLGDSFAAKRFGLQTGCA